MPVHVGAHELAGAVDGAVDVGLGGEVEDDVGRGLAQSVATDVAIADVALDEAVARVVGDGGEVVEIAGVGEPVVDDDLGLGLVFEQVVDEVRADEPGAARYEIGS